MPTFRQLQDEVLQLVTGYGLEQPRTLFLAATLTEGATTATVTDASNAEQGLAEVDSELVYIQSVDKVTNVLTFAPDGRGYLGTTAEQHASGTRVTVNPTWSRNRIKAAINDTITGTYPMLFGIDSAQFTYNPSTTTYELPAVAKRVLAVSADLNGPSREQQRITRYSFNAVAPGDDWPTGATVSLHEPASPGRTVTVTYASTPGQLTNDGDFLTDSGLQDSAKLAIVYGACAMLVSYMDVARLPADTSTAAEYAQANALGMATRISTQLYLRYQQELDNERQRLRATAPIPMFTRMR